MGLGNTVIYPKPWVPSAGLGCRPLEVRSEGQLAHLGPASRGLGSGFGITTELLGSLV